MTDWLDGQSRRRWLNEKNEQIGNALRYYMGPAAEPVNALAQGAAALSPGADMMDMYQSSGDLMNSKGGWDAAKNAGWLGASALGMALPGNVGMMRGYHGSATAGLDEIAPQSTRGALGPGAYFSPAKNVAERYGENVYEADLDGIFDGIGSRASDVNPYQVWRDQTAKLVAAAPEDKRDEIAAIAGKLSSGDGYPLYVRIAQSFRDEGKAQDLFKRAGFKGLSGSADGPEIVMFDPVRVGGR